jgi:hypothetical protein
MKRHLLKSLLPLGLCFSIFLDGLLPAAIAQNVPARISLVVVEGQGVTNTIHQRVAKDPVVQIEDDDHRPVAGAAVVFALPVAGTSGEFINGSKTLTAVTDNDGLAVARGLKTNQVPGKLQIYVTASYHGLRARTLVTQFVEAPAGTNVKVPEIQPAKSGGKWKWVVLGIVAAGGAGAGVYFGRNTSSSSSPISIGTGPIVFGSPR